MRSPVANSIAGAAIAAMLFCGPAARADTGSDPADLERTWESARVYAPADTPPGFDETTGGGLATFLPSSDADPGAVILYAHGCDGLSRITDVTGRFLAQAGYLVIAPDSFARETKPTSCDPASHRGGLHRAVLGWRHAEMQNAARHIAGLPALAELPLILMGHSEGAITVATVTGLPSAARIVEGWTCHAGWPEYRGLNAPEGAPVLALVGENDPWFKSPVLTGDCGAFLDDTGGSRSIVYRAPDYRAGRHWLSGDRDVQDEILDFIDRVLGQQGENDAG